jgi:type II secretory pathway component PulC
MSALNKAKFGRVTSYMTWLCLLILPAAYGFSFWHWQRNIDADFMPQAPVAEASLKVDKPDYKQLALLFGDAQAEPAAAPIKESTLSLKLVASYVGGKQGRSAAVIASSESNHQLYYQGDKLLPGVELVTVQARRVLIKRNGVLESVQLEEDQATGAMQAVPAALVHNPVATPSAEPLSQQKLTDKLNKLKALASGEI